MPTRGKIYIAGPMTGYEDSNYPLFNEVATVLRDAEWEVINPAEWEPEVSPTFSFNRKLAIYLREDFEKLSTCGHVVFLPGWADSIGANCELFLAQMLGLTTHVWENDAVRKEVNLYANLDTIIGHINEVYWPGEEA